MYSSWFSYSVSRPYPFRWFAPVAIIRAIILTVLFTLVNLASSAFYLKPIFTEDPNSTVADSTRLLSQTSANRSGKIRYQPFVHLLTLLGKINHNGKSLYSGRPDQFYDYVIDDNYKTHTSNVPVGNDYWLDLHSYCIHELGYFDLKAWFFSSDGYRQTRDLYSTRIAHGNPRYVKIVSESLHYTKILHSLVAVDLGNCRSPNLLRQDKLAYAILPSDDPNRQLGGLLNNTMYSVYAEIPSPRPQDGWVMLNETYQRILPETGPLKCEEVRIVSQYLCSIPESCMSHESQLSLKESRQVSGSYQEIRTSEAN
ncbi:hypothetical protein FSARC_8925 [Fusarium sarcochroum]|uniref:Uncharacterized protein n=1 Tax=Fusarium sarcochroum TaxID=1208366 RepID=A0A8H4TS03_9HYPO|nr:hypothetical protein FSARC_8925 [Fusarium sarcochroum]